MRRAGVPRLGAANPLPTCFSPSWSSRRCCLSHCLQKTPAQGRAGAGTGSAAPHGFLTLDPGWVGALASTATLGPDGGWAPRAELEGGRGKGGVGEAVGGIDCSNGVLRPGSLTAYSRPPRFRIWGAQISADYTMMEMRLQLVGSEKRGTL